MLYYEKVGGAMFQQVLCDWPGINPRVEKVALRCGTRAGHGKVAERPRGVVGDTQIMRGGMRGSHPHFTSASERDDICRRNFFPLYKSQPAASPFLPLVEGKTEQRGGEETEAGEPRRTSTSTRTQSQWAEGNTSTGATGEAGLLVS